MLKLVNVLVFFLGFTVLGNCQENKNIQSFEIENYTSYASRIVPSVINISKSDIKYQSIFDDIYRVSSGNNNPDVCFYETYFNDIAFSVINGSERYIFYNRDLFDSIVNTTGTINSIRSIIAHELSHLLNNHPLRYTSSSHIFEKEADYYSGKILRHFQATLSESIAAMNICGNEKETITHPAKSVRLKEIKRGWIDESFLIFNNYMLEFDSMLYQTAKNECLFDSILRQEIDYTFSSFLDSRQWFISIIDSLRITEESIQTYFGIVDTSIYNLVDFSDELLKYDFITKNENENKNLSPISISDFFVAVLYEVPVLFSEDKVYNLQGELMGTIEKLDDEFFYKITLEERKYYVASDNKVYAYFSDGSNSVIGYILN